MPEDHPDIQKRNCGRTGPTSEEGRAISARNATRHGMCSTTLVMDGEVEADWLDLLKTWLDGYQNPAENSLLYTFVLKVAQAEWQRLRVQREYDFHMYGHGSPPIGAWQPLEIKTHDLILRYLTAAERRFQREYRLLEHHFKTHAAPVAHTGRNGNHHKPAPEPQKPEFSKEMPKIYFVNNETGESVDAQGNEYPPPPGYKPRTIIPGVYPPDHPAYEPPASPTGRNGNHQGPPRRKTR
jgi:hypothetical protein